MYNQRSRQEFRHLQGQSISKNGNYVIHQCRAELRARSSDVGIQAASQIRTIDARHSAHYRETEKI